MTHTAVPKSFSKILLACAVCLFFGLAAPMAFAQSHGGGGTHGGGASHASGGSHSGGGHSGSFGGARGSGGGGGAQGRGSYGMASGAAANGSSGRSSGTAKWFGGSSATGGTAAARSGAGAEGTGPGSSAARGFTRTIFEPSAESSLGRSAASDARSLGQQARIANDTRGIAQGSIVETLGTGQAQVILNASAPVRYELVGREWVITGETQQQRPGYTPPQAAQAPRPIVTPPSTIPPMQAPRPITAPPQNPIQTQRPVTPPPAMPVQNPIRPVGTPANPASPPIVRMPGQQPVVRFPIAQPPANPVQPVRPPAAPLPPPMVRFPVQPVMRVPAGRVRLPGTPGFRPPIAPPVKSPLFNPAVTPPGRMPIRPVRPISRGPFGLASEAPPIRRVFDGMSRRGAPFVVMSTPPPHFDAHPCFQTITNCGFGFGFGDGDFDFDDGFFFFGFPFGSPFFFGPFGFPIFDLGPQCFFNGIVEPCAFTPLGFAQFQAFGPNGWGWSWLGWGNGWFYSPPEPPSEPPWNSTETNPGLNLQYFTNEVYVPYSEPSAPAPQAANEPNAAGAQENQNVVTEIATTDDLVFGVTSYWLEDNQLCYVTTYKIKNCIPMTRVDLQKTVDMNYQRGVKFTLTPKPPDEKQP